MSGSSARDPVIALGQIQAITCLHQRVLILHGDHIAHCLCNRRGLREMLQVREHRLAAERIDQGYDKNSPSCIPGLCNAADY